MELKYCILGCIMMILAPEAHAITASFSGGSGGVSCVSTTTFSANDLDSVSLRSVLGEDCLSQTISGSGNLNENHSIGSAQGSYAEVGAKVIDSGKYEYTYTLTPGDQGHSDSRAAQSLTVSNATYIRAWSRAKNTEVGDAFADMEVMNGDLNGYTSSAYASDDYVTVSQEINKIDHADHMETRTWAGSRYPSSERYSAHAGAEMNEGGLNWYSAEASTNNSEAKARQYLSSDYAKFLEGWIGAYDHCDLNSIYNYSGAYANTQVRGGDLWHGGNSVANINGAQVSQYSWSDYAKYVRSNTGAHSGHGVFWENNISCGGNSTSNGAFASTEVRDGGAYLSGEAHVYDYESAVHQGSSVPYAKYIRSSIDAYKGHGWWYCTNDSCSGNYTTDASVSALISVTEGDAYLYGDADLGKDRLSVHQRCDIDFAEKANIKAGTYREGPPTEKKLETTEAGLSTDIYADMSNNDTHVDIRDDTPLH